MISLEKGIKIIIKHITCRILKFKNKTLIVFGSPFLNHHSIRNFKECYNVHMGDLPKYSGLKSFERMYLKENI